jgi:hypothetical protein
MNIFTTALAVFIGVYILPVAAGLIWTIVREILTGLGIVAMGLIALFIQILIYLRNFFTCMIGDQYRHCEHCKKYFNFSETYNGIYCSYDCYESNN